MALLLTLHHIGIVVAHGLEPLSREEPMQRRPSRRGAPGEITLLDPNWLTQAIYRILNDSQIVQQRGEFDLVDLARILEPDDYPPARHGFILDMMLHPSMGMAFPLPDRGRERYLLPESLPVQGPVQGPPGGNVVRRRYRYGHLAKGLMARLIAAAHDRLEEGQSCWHAGCILRIGACRAWVIADESRDAIDITVEGAPGLMHGAMQAVTDIVEQTHERFGIANATAHIPLTDQPDLDVSLSHLEQLLEDEGPKHRFRPEGAARKYGLRELIPWEIQDEPKALWWEDDGLRAGLVGSVIAALISFDLGASLPMTIAFALGAGTSLVALTRYYHPSNFYKRMIAALVVPVALVAIGGGLKAQLQGTGFEMLVSWLPGFNWPSAFGIVAICCILVGADFVFNRPERHRRKDQT